MSYHVRVGFDLEHRRYFVVESQIPGLNVETTDLGEFVAIAQDAAPDLLGEHERDAKIRFTVDVVVPILA